MVKIQISLFNHFVTRQDSKLSNQSPNVGDSGISDYYFHLGKFAYFPLVVLA